MSQSHKIFDSKLSAKEQAIQTHLPKSLCSAVKNLGLLDGKEHEFSIKENGQEVNIKLKLICNLNEGESKDGPAKKNESGDVEIRIKRYVELRDVFKNQKITARAIVLPGDTYRRVVLPGDTYRGGYNYEPVQQLECEEVTDKVVKYYNDVFNAINASKSLFCCLIM